MTRARSAGLPGRSSPLQSAGWRVVLVSLFFCSGAVALIYEVLWQRQFGLVFGSAAPATAAVLAAYFAGLAGGSLVLGTRSKQLARPLRVYALLEGMVGLGALLVVPALKFFETIHPWLFAHLAGSSAGSFVVKTLLVFIALAIPTFCLGGTLPVLGQLVDRHQRSLGTNTGLLYVANTSGAVLGTLAVPFIILPRLGLSGTLWLSAALNFCIAMAAWRLDRNWASPEAEGPEATSVSRSMILPLGWKSPLLTLSLVSGLATFILQVQWNRAFSQVHENSMYSFAVIVAVFILALAAGGQLSRVLILRKVAPEKVIGWGWILGGIAAAVSLWIFLQLTDGLEYLPTSRGWTSYAARLLSYAAAVLFVPVTLLGMGWPAIMELAGRRSQASPGEILGSVLAWNLVGAVAGALLAGFVLPRWLTLWNGILVVALGLVIGGGWQLIERRKRVPFAIAALVSASLWPLARIDLPRVKIEPQHGERVIAISEGVHGIVAVIERPNSRRLKLNNHYVLGGTASTGDERMQAHIPLLLHSAPRRVAFLGLGTGITASGGLFHPVHSITGVELVPEVVSAARSHFREANARFLEDPRTRVLVEDARSFLRAAAPEFDVIVGDLIVPWRQGEGALLTLEQFLAARRALAPGGLFCQWLPMFQLSRTELDILIRTFLSVFPRASVWRGDFSPDQPAIALVGSVQPLELNPAQVLRRHREMRPDSSNPQLVQASAFWMHFIGILDQQDLPASETRINREEQPWIELLGPMEHAGQGATNLCVGRQLQEWFSDVRRKSQTRISILGPDEVTAVQAGDLLFEFTLLLSEGKQPAARAVQDQLRPVLKPEVFNAIFGPSLFPVE